MAGFGPDDVTRLLADPGIVRNRAKIEAAIGNARAALALPGGWPRWSGATRTGRDAAPVTLADVPSWTPGSKALAKELKRNGFSFTGPVTVYAALQACGVVDDHLESCFRRGAYRSLRNL